MTNKQYDQLPASEYQYGFHDEDVSLFRTRKGINREIVEEISRIKGEPQWLLDFRLKSLEVFLKKPMPTWGADLSELNFDEYTYYIKPSERMMNDWADVPDTIKDTFNRLGIPEAERKFLSGVATQYESEMVYHNMLEEVESKGVIFTDPDTAFKKYEHIFRPFFGSIVPYSDNKFAALNSAVFSGGSFIYIPKGVKLDKPLQSYFRINTEQMGQFERTLIIVDEGADVHYVEGCTAPTYSKDSLHAAVVEIYVHPKAKCRYTTIQNWSMNVLNLVTKRAKVMDHGVMEWIDGNIGAHVTMKYPACILAGEYARGMTISIAVSSHINQIQDAGAKMVHLAPYTSSNIISKSVARNGGEVNYRGLVQHSAKAKYARSKIECDTLLMDGNSRSDTLPTNISYNPLSTIEHEATVSRVSEDQLFYLMSRGLNKSQALETIVMGFLEPFTRELPMEYAVELNQLMKLDMEGSVG